MRGSQHGISLEYVCFWNCCAHQLVRPFAARIPKSMLSSAGSEALFLHPSIALCSSAQLLSLQDTVSDMLPTIAVVSGR